jgi:hypothetical protein
MKDCNKCGELKPLEDFHKSKLGKMGRKGQCKECCAARDLSTRPQRLAKQKEWRENMPESKRAEYRAANAEFYRSKPEKKRANTRARQASQKQRTPAWSNPASIQKLYEKAANLEAATGIQFHVDHIIPLQGRLVSGLHVASNLQVIPALDNLRKSNKFVSGTNA